MQDVLLICIPYKLRNGQRALEAKRHESESADENFGAPKDEEENGLTKSVNGDEIQ